MTAVVSLCFALCWMPYCLAMMIMLFGLPGKGILHRGENFFSLPIEQGIYGKRRGNE